MGRQAVRLVLLQDLLAAQNLLDLLVDLPLVVAIEDTVDRLQLVVDDQQVSLLVSL